MFSLIINQNGLIKREKEKERLKGKPQTICKDDRIQLDKVAVADDALGVWKSDRFDVDEIVISDEIEGNLFAVQEITCGVQVRGHFVFEEAPFRIIFSDKVINDRVEFVEIVLMSLRIL